MKNSRRGSNRGRILLVCACIFLFGAPFFLHKCVAPLDVFEEVIFAKRLLVEVYHNDKPSDEWINVYAQSGEAHWRYYYLKIFFLDEGIGYVNLLLVQAQDITLNEVVRFSFKHRKYSPVMKLVVGGLDGTMKMSVDFELNNCLFHPDLNDDNRVDLDDYIIAKQRKMAVSP